MTATAITSNQTVAESAAEQFRLLDKAAVEAAQQAHGNAAETLRHAWDAGQIVSHAADSGIDMIAFASSVGRPVAILQRYRSLHTRRKREELNDPAQLRLFTLPEEQEHGGDDPRPNQRRERDEWEGCLSKLMIAFSKHKQGKPIESWSRGELERGRALLRPLGESLRQIERRLEEV
jgi:Zn-dependent oligopeptidase